MADVVIIALGVGSILFDGLSQTQIWFDLFGLPSLPARRCCSSASSGIIVAAALAVTRFVGVAATGAGLLPIAVGYLIAHYLTYLLIDGQRIIIAISDPFQQGWDLFGTAFYQVVRRVAAARPRVDRAAGGRRRRAHARRLGRPRGGGARGAARHVGRGRLRRRQIPLAVVMVALTTLTLWSLGQSIVVTPEDGARRAQTVATSRGG